MTNQFTPQYPCVEAKASTLNFSKERYFMAYELPPLPYDYSALEPYIDTQTMQLHHDKHHAAYVNNLNAALQNNSEFASLPIDELVRRLNDVPENIRTAVRPSARLMHSRLHSTMQELSALVQVGRGWSLIETANFRLCRLLTRIAH